MIKIRQGMKDSRSARLFSWYRSPFCMPEVAWKNLSCRGTVEVFQRKNAPKKKSPCTVISLNRPWKKLTTNKERLGKI